MVCGCLQSFLLCKGKHAFGQICFRHAFLAPANTACAAGTRGQLAAHPSPKNLKLPLLAFQAEGEVSDCALPTWTVACEGLGWMLEREADKLTRGGILADEMGMGKTLQTISLILAGRLRLLLCAFAARQGLRLLGTFHVKPGAPGATLVVCPAAAMLQWRNEILRFTEPGSCDRSATAPRPLCSILSHSVPFCPITSHYVPLDFWSPSCFVCLCSFALWTSWQTQSSDQAAWRFGSTMARKRRRSWAT